jgi:hypothetical protein
VDDFCAARTGEIPALLLPNFAPPYTLLQLAGHVYFTKLKNCNMIEFAHITDLIQFTAFEPVFCVS